MSPNVVLLLCDQLRAMDVGCYGNEVIQTPHIDALARRGLRCSRALSNNPVCVPARSILMTGQYSRTCTGSLHNHAPNDPVNRERHRLLDPTWPEVMKEAGYDTQLIGKWHIDPAPDLVGFDHWVSPVSIGSQGRFMEDGDYIGRKLGFAQDYELQRFGEFCDSRSRESSAKPFFCFHNLYSPHMPLADMPLVYHRMYDREEIPLRPNLQGREVPEHWLRCYLWEHADGQGGTWPSTDRVPDGFDVRDLTALYYGAIHWVDDLVGGVLAHLDRTGLRENTIVVFASDHGDNLGSHGVWNKDRFWEESIRIPLILDDPRAPGGGELEAPVGLVDCMPTLLERCGIAVPEHVQGTSFAKSVEDPSQESDIQEAFIETTTWEVAVVDRRYKYARRTEIESGKSLRPQQRSDVDDLPEFFFDLKQDPYEQINRIGHLQHQARIREMRQKLEAWDRETPWLDLETGNKVCRSAVWLSPQAGGLSSIGGTEM